MFILQLTESRRKPKPQNTTTVLTYSPSTARSGTRIKAVIITHSGKLLAINTTATTTIILVTFWSRLEVAPACPEWVERFRHSDWMFMLTTKVTVQTMTDRKAARGVNTLLIGVEIFSTSPRMSLKIRPKTVLFLTTENFTPIVLT